MDEFPTREPEDGLQGGGLEPSDQVPAEPSPTQPIPSDDTPASSTPPDIAASPEATGPMPLSMPPYAAASSEGTGPMPLSMPPYGGGTPPPPPPGNSWAFAAPYEPPLPLGGSGVAAGSSGGRSRSRQGLAIFGAAALLAAGIGAGLGVGLSGTAPASSGSPALPASAAPLAPASSVSAVSKAVTPAVVDIATTVPTANGIEQAAGTGMILTSSGEVLTNNHVVEGASTIRVSIQGRSGTYSASVVGVDPTKDVALIQIAGVSGLPHVSLGNSASVTVGTSVVALGNALGLGGAPTVVSGSITGLGRSITAENDGNGSSEPLSGLLETDAEIQPGDSGGPLVDSSGQVIGMDTAAESDDGGPTIGFAIPINEAKTIVEDIQHRDATDGVILGLSAFLGVEVIGASNNATAGNGLNIGGYGFPSSGLGFNNTGSAATPSSGQFIEGLVPNGPAASAGIVAGDTITSINGVAVNNDPSSLTDALAKLKPGTKVSVGVVTSSGTSQTVTVDLGATPK